MSKKKQLKSFEIVSMAVFLLGGDSKFVDTEDVAIKANSLAPGLFTWQKYKDQVSFDHVRRKLTEATQQKSGGFLVGSVRRGWQLTPAGLEFAQSEAPLLTDRETGKERLDGKAQMRLRLERERLRSTRAYQKFYAKAVAEITLEETNAFFRVDEYVPASIREGKILRVLNNFSTDEEFGPLVRILFERLKNETNTNLRT